MSVRGVITVPTSVLVNPTTFSSISAATSSSSPSRVESSIERRSRSSASCSRILAPLTTDRLVADHGDSRDRGEEQIQDPKEAEAPHDQTGPEVAGDRTGEHAGGEPQQDDRDGDRARSRGGPATPPPRSGSAVVKPTSAPSKQATSVDSRARRPKTAGGSVLGASICRRSRAPRRSSISAGWVPAGPDADCSSRCRAAAAPPRCRAADRSRGPPDGRRADPDRLEQPVLLEVHPVAGVLLVIVEAEMRRTPCTA